MLQCVSWCRGFGAGRISRARQPARFLVLPASNFNDLLHDAHVSNDEAAFIGNPLNELGHTERGRVFAKLARQIDADNNPTSMFDDPVSCTCANGSQTGVYRSPYDWSRDDLRIECKSSSLRWCSSARHWGFLFGSIKFPHYDVREVACFDELILVFFTPRNLYFYVHDGKLGVSACGVERTRAAGHSVKLRGPSGEVDWERSCNHIFHKLDHASNNCFRLAVMECTDPRVVEVLQSEGTNVTRSVYVDSPLQRMSPPRRGLRIEALTRRVDALVHPGSLITDPGACSDRKNYLPQYDWKRDDRRIECKSSQLHWDRYHERWKVAFTGIKHSIGVGFATSYFDELLLSLYTPQGIYVYRHDLDFGMSSRGGSTSWSGHQVQVYAPMRMYHWQPALENIISKLERSGCQRIAWIQW